MLYRLYLHISKTRNLLLSVTTITNLSVLLYLISINKILVLILKLVPLILEIVKILFFFQPAGHIGTGNLKIDSRIRSVISKRPKYRFSAHIDFN